MPISPEKIADAVTNQTFPNGESHNQTVANYACTDSDIAICKRTILLAYKI